MNKKSIKQNLTRQNKWGMTPSQIRNAINQPVSKKDPPKPVKLTQQSVRPERIRRTTHDLDLDLMLECHVVPPTDYSEIIVSDRFLFQGKADVSVIVPLFKSATVVKDLMDSWDQVNDGLKVELIFVDDNCPMKTGNFIVQEWEKKGFGKSIGKIIVSKETHGYAASCNQGARYATANYLIFLNADTVVTPGWIRPIIRSLRKEDIGIVGNLQYKDKTNLFDSAGSEWNWETMSFLHIGRDVYKQKRLSGPFTLSNYPKDLDETEEREMVTGACLAIKKELFLEIGGFNPNYRVGYWEDSELCMSVREKGFKIIYQPNSKIYHKGGHTNSGGHRYLSHNQRFFANKWVNNGRIDSLIKAKRLRPAPDVKNILIIREASHGDVLLAASVAFPLKKKFPEAKIAFLTSCPEVVEKHPAIDYVVSKRNLQIQKFQFICNLDMGYEFRPKTNILVAYADIAGVHPDQCKLFLRTDAVSDNLPNQYIVVHAGKTRWAGRDWSPHKFNLLTTKLRQNGQFVVNVGTKSDHNVNCDLDLRGKTSISQLAGVIKHADLFVGIDSFPMHVAQTFDIPGVAFFGSIDPSTRIIRNNMFGISASSLACIGCHHRKPPSVVTDACETELQDCINQVSVEQMLSKINQILDKRKA